MPGDEHFTNNNFTSLETRRMVRFTKLAKRLGAELLVSLTRSFPPF
jgi:hypothetical protein